METVSPLAPRPTDGLRIGLALGGGGARGLSHVHVLDALDDLGIVPVAIAGSSIGALFGAGYAAGLSGRELRDIAAEAFRRPADVWGKVWQLRPKRFADLFGGGLVQFDPETVLSLFVPDVLPETFAELKIPLTVVAADFYGCREVELTDGKLRRAIAASIALPIVFRPVAIDDVQLIDGGVVNPLPFDRLPADVDLVIAVDVVGGPAPPAGRQVPTARETMVGASQILMQSVIAEKLKSRRPDILIRPPVEAFAVLDFLKANAILKATAPVKDVVKRAIDAALEERRVSGEP